jgi:hypothetical protein
MVGTEFGHIKVAGPRLAVVAVYPLHEVVDLV